MGLVGFYLPVKTLKTTGSTCNNKTSTFVMTFTPDNKANVDDWKISMNFTMDTNSNYAMTNFSVEYTLDPDLFPDINVTTPGNDTVVPPPPPPPPLIVFPSCVALDSFCPMLTLVHDFLVPWYQCSNTRYDTFLNENEESSDKNKTWSGLQTFLKVLWDVLGICIADFSLSKTDTFLAGIVIFTNGFFYNFSQ